MPEDQPETVVPEVVETDLPEVEEFDKERALATIKKQREAEATAKQRAKELEAKLKEFEDRDKTETERVAERLTQAEKRAAEAEAKALRFEVAAAKQVPSNLLRFLNGSSQEELEEQADELLKAVTPEPDADDGTQRRPKERLRPGAVPDAEPAEVEPGIGRLMRAYAQTPDK